MSPGCSTAAASAALDVLLGSVPADEELGSVVKALALARNMTGRSDGLAVDEGFIDDMLAKLSGYGAAEGLQALYTLYVLSGDAEFAGLMDGMGALLPPAAYSGAAQGQSAGGLIGYGPNMKINGAALRGIAAWAGACAQGDTYAAALKNTGMWNLPAEQTPRAVTGAEQAKFDGETGSYMAGLLGLLEYAEASGDVRAAHFVRTGYEYMRTFGVNAIGLFGDIETTSYMTMLAVKLSLMGAGDYWDDVERYVRNELAEKQQADGSFLKDSSYPGFVKDSNAAAPLSTTAAAVEALYSAWDAIVTGNASMAVVNLPLNKSSFLLDVKSSLPYEGKVELEIKAAENVTVRIPKWVNMNTVSVSGCTSLRTDHMVILLGVSKGAEVTIRFEMKEWNRIYSLKWNPEDATHTCITPASGWVAAVNPNNMFDVTFRGYTAVSIAAAVSNGLLPAGVGLYDRDGMSGAAPIGEKEVYAPYVTLNTKGAKAGATLVSAVPSAYVTKLPGSKNDLTITVTETYSDGSVNEITVTIRINNNAAGTYTVGNYRVYVDTKGNDQIRQCYIVA